MVVFWVLKSLRVVGLLNNFIKVVLGIFVWWFGVVFILFIIYLLFFNDFVIFFGLGVGLFDVFESMVFFVFMVVLIFFWYFVVEFYFLLSREVFNFYVSYKCVMGFFENRILMFVFRVIFVLVLFIWFFYLIEVEGIVIVVDYFFKFGGLG